MIPYGRQDIRQQDIDAVVAVLQSDFLTQGPQVPAFEQAVAAYCGAKYAVAVNSATSALHLACLALGLGPGDWLWTSPITFTASANCALYCGAQVDFVDIDPHTLNMSVAALRAKLALAKQQQRLPKVVVPVHLCGQPCDMAAIHALAQEYGFAIIEDASHAIGARHQQQPVGSCRYSDITVFSFHPVKIITTAEGGMALTNQAHLAEKMALLRSHGITRDPAQMTQPADGAWYYQQVDLGFNYRMTELQAALGLSQLTRLDEYIEQRHALARRYHQALAALPLTLPQQHPDAYSAYHLYVVRLHDASRRRAVFDALRQDGIGVNVHYIPVHTQPYYRQRFGFKLGDFAEAERYYQAALSLPMYPQLSDVDFEQVCDSLRRVLA